MARAAIRQIVFGAAAASLLMGCVEGAGSPTVGADATSITPATRRSGNQDIEAPEVFQVTDTALWDGRPSLGGIWVASPDTKDPERVVMVNTANGQTVTGALFRRERDNPGPTLQISSDAADALGILAGQPAEIRVTALRKSEAAAPAEAAPAASAEGTAVAGTEGDAAAAPADPAEATAIATAALDAVDAGAGAGVAAADAAVAPSEAAPVAAPEAAPAKKKTWKERRAEAKAEREAARAAKAAAAGAATSDAPATDTSGVVASDTAVVSPIETAPLDARSTEVAESAAAATIGTETPAPEKRKTRRQIKAAADAAAAAAAAAPAPVPPAEVPAANARPIQVASFSKEENANRAVEALAKVGVTGSARKGDNGGKVVWGVVAMGDEALLQSIKKAGFADAFFLK
jgi:rare lipoprotein A